jgi:hypothetical protein
MVRFEASDHGEDERPAVVQSFAGSVEDVEDGVQLLLAYIRIGYGGQLGLEWHEADDVPNQLRVYG